MVPLHEFVASKLLAQLVVWWKIAGEFEAVTDIVSEEKM
jgi:hypothetical protein